MFQDINVAKSAPFALLTIYQKKKIPVSPQNIQSAPISANYAKFTDHSLFEPREMETSNITANCAKFA